MWLGKRIGAWNVMNWIYHILHYSSTAIINEEEKSWGQNVSASTVYFRSFHAHHFSLLALSSFCPPPYLCSTSEMNSTKVQTKMGKREKVEGANYEDQKSVNRTRQRLSPRHVWPSLHCPIMHPLGWWVHTTHRSINEERRKDVKVKGEGLLQLSTLAHLVQISCPQFSPKTKYLFLPCVDPNDRVQTLLFISESQKKNASWWWTMNRVGVQKPDVEMSRVLGDYADQVPRGVFSLTQVFFYSSLIRQPSRHCIISLLL